MKDAITLVLKDYLLSKDTDYALMINGEWGSGKTYFVLNEIKPLVESINFSLENEEKFKFVYVSLYGVSSLDEVKDTIFYSLYPKFKLIEILTSKIVTATKYIPKLGDSVNNLLKIKREDKEIIKNAITKVSDKILFFDDLERINSNKIDIQTILGYINYLSEHKKYKIVVIANDKKLGENYAEFKEKTVRFSYNYIPDLSEVFNSVIGRYDKEYSKFLSDNKSTIFRVFSLAHCLNIRTLIFTTDLFYDVFKQVGGRYKTEINLDLLLPFLVITIEAKCGHIKEELNEVLPQIQSISSQLSSGKFDLDLSNSNDDGSVSVMSRAKMSKEEYISKIKKQYESLNGNLTFYPELFDLVFDGYVPKERIEKLIHDIRDNYISREVTLELKLLRLIVDWTHIPDEDFISVISGIKTAVLQNKYNVFEILKIYASFIQIDLMKIGGFNLTEEVIEKFESAISVSMEGKPYYNLFDVQATIWDLNDRSEAKDKYNKLRNYACKLNLKNKSTDDSKQIEAVLNMIKNGEVEPFEKFMYDYNNKLVFVEIDKQELIKAVGSASVDIKRIFVAGLVQFFPDNLTNPSSADVEYLSGVKDALDSYLAEQSCRKVSNANLYYLQDYINKTIIEYKK